MCDPHIEYLFEVTSNFVLDCSLKENESASINHKRKNGLRGHRMFYPNNWLEADFMNKLFIIDLKILFEDGERSRTFAILASLFVNFDTIRQFAQKYTTKLL